MAALWIIVTFAFTFTTLGLVAYAVVRAFSGDASEHLTAAPTVDAGWRANTFHH